MTERISERTELSERTKLSVRTKLSERTKSAFQVVSVIAIAMVVAIHYRSAAPSSDDFRLATANALTQDWIANGLCRIAVPLFALASGFFYFLSADNTLACHLSKWHKRVFTLLVPYLAMSGIAITSWLLIRFLEDDPAGLSAGQWIWMAVVSPPAEQLWFVRDLLVLMLLAPLIQRFVQTRLPVYLAVVSTAWLLNVNGAPLLGKWYLFHVETLTFFSWGAWFAQSPSRMERCLSLPVRGVVTVAVVWLSLLTARVILQPNFDAWYTQVYTLPTLLIHQGAIVAGMVTCLTVAGRLRPGSGARLSGVAFFVYLVHEFPVRAVAQRVISYGGLEEQAFWILTPVVAVGCFVAGEWISRWLPGIYATFTGGRSPQRAVQIGQARPVGDASGWPSARVRG